VKEEEEPFLLSFKGGQRGRGFPNVALDATVRNAHDMGTKEEVKPNFRTPPR
jgi:hypothetical protein